MFVLRAIGWLLLLAGVAAFGLLLALSDEFLAKHPSLGPRTYHPRRLGDTVFPRKMERLLCLNEAAEERRHRTEVVNS